MGISIRQKYYFVIELATVIISVALLFFVIYWGLLIAKEVQSNVFEWKLWLEKVLFLFGTVILYRIVINIAGYEKVSLSPFCYNLKSAASSELVEQIANYFMAETIWLNKEREDLFCYFQTCKKDKHTRILLMEMEKFDKGSFKLNQWRFSRMMNKSGKENHNFIKYLNVIIVKDFNDQLNPILHKNVRHTKTFTIVVCLEEKKLYVPAYFGAGHFIRYFLLHHKVHNCFESLFEMNHQKVE